MPVSPSSAFSPFAQLGRVAHRIVRGRSDEAAWVQPSLFGLVALAAVLYLWNLTISGYANTYYSAAAESASNSWSAFFFGSFDSSNFITWPSRHWQSCS
jgi:hypothetical protein